MNTPLQPPPVDGHDAPGWYGKLAMLGDFAQRRLPVEFVRHCDDWLARAMGAERQDAPWLDNYLRAPVLRFAWAPGVFDAQWWFGVLMASCDQVGRYFPLVVVQRRPRPPLDRIAQDHLELWFEHLAQAALLTLQEGATIDAFEDALQGTPPWPTPGAAAPMRASAAGLHYAISRSASLHECLHAVAAHELLARMAGHSVWWRSSEGAQDSTMSLVRGLPDANAFAALLSGG